MLGGCGLSAGIPLPVDTTQSARPSPARPPIYLQNRPGKYLVRNQDSHDSHHKIYPFP